MKKYLIIVTRYLTFSILLLVVKIDYAQTNYNDSLYFSTVFQTPIYQDYYLLPGAFYLYPFVQTRAGLFDSLNSQFKFSGPEYYGSYDAMQVGDLYPVDSINKTLNYYYSQGSEFAYKQTNPVWGLPFSLNNKNSITYCTYTPGNSGNTCKTAVLFITGSGENNGTQMVRGEGYQNDYGFMKDSLATMGDVYIAIRPLIDFRALVWDRPENPLALNSEFPIPNQISNYLNGRGTAYGVNSLIESIALVKYLKSKYQRVIIAGLSFGGIYTTLNALEAAPEGALISGGYTMLVDQLQESDFQVGSFGPLFYSLNRDSVKQNIGKTATEFLFSWGRGGDIYEETDLHYTENYFTGLDNTQYFYDYNLHTFPPLKAFKNLFDSVNIHASVRIKEIKRNCTSAKIMVIFCGQKPYQFDIYKDSVLYHSFSSLNDTFNIDLTETGIYKVKNAFDKNNVKGYSSDNYLLQPCINNTNFNPAKLVAFPNPFSKQFNLYIELPESTTLDIFDVTGRIVKSVIIENGLNLINMEGINKDIYILKVRYKGKGYRFDTLKIILL
ncbi:MAG: T9SS type A sorting domain-containing protein [Ginsengibacter sp.]